MIGDLQQPSVVDLEALLQPIEGENPSGESLRYAGTYDEIADARRADDNLNQGAWQTEVKYADYRKVIDLAVPALTRSKDLQIGAWLSEALTKEYNFIGLRDSLKLLTGLQENFWDTLYPEIDEGDMSGRANAISWLDTQASLFVMALPFTGGEHHSYIDWEDSKTYDFPDNIESLDTAEQVRINQLKEQAAAQNKVTADRWRKAVAATRRLEVEITNFAIDECWTELSNLNRVIEEKYDRNQMPGLSNFRKALDTVHTQVKKLLEQKRIEEPDESDVEEGAEGEVSADGTAVKASGGGGPIQTRKDALKRLAEIADFFQKTEPHSPVSYLVTRAVKWGNMPLESWLKDVIKDETVLFNLRQTLGFNTTDADGNNNPQG
jgi:type VI secretion system protein ImpA